jgi:protein-S-isoprenylcysteine O-methyltransferase Ste14
MFMGLLGGMNSDVPATSLGSALVTDIILLAQFPVIHTLLLRPAGRRFLASLFPGELGKHLITTTFVIAASLQLLILFLLWSHIGTSQWEPSGTLRAIWIGAYATSWALLAITMTNAGLSTQMGYLGWTAVFRGQSPQYPTFPKHGFHKICRHPVYFSMALVSCTGPIWNFDHALITVVFLTYCVLGPKAKEHRLLATHGPEFEKYLRETPFFPTPASCWRALVKPGAAWDGLE